MKYVIHPATGWTRTARLSRTWWRSEKTNNKADVQLTEGPWYACQKVPTVHHTMGGLKINADTQVLGKKDTVIPGLFACGEVTGGIHGSNRLGGNAIVDCMVFGRLAGASAAAGK